MENLINFIVFAIGVVVLFLLFIHPCEDTATIPEPKPVEVNKPVIEETIELDPETQKFWDDLYEAKQRLNEPVNFPPVEDDKEEEKSLESKEPVEVDSTIEWAVDWDRLPVIK